MPDIYKPSFLYKLALAACAVIAAASLGGMLLFVQQEAREDRDTEQEAIDLNYLSCLRGNEIRQVLLDNEREPSPPLDLTVLPSVQAAPQWFQDVTAELRDLSTALAQKPIDPDSRSGRRIARIEMQIRDCEQEWAGHTEGLRLPHEEPVG